jgi:hypothetical protein
MLTFLTELGSITVEILSAHGFLQTMGITCAVFLMLGAFIHSRGFTVPIFVSTILAFIVAQEWLRYVYLTALGQTVTPRPALLALITLSALAASFAAGTFLDRYMTQRAQERMKPLQEAQAKLESAKTEPEISEAVKEAKHVLATEEE